MHSTPRHARLRTQRLDPRYGAYLGPAIMAVAMSFAMSLVGTIATQDLAPDVMSAWLGNFARGVAVAVPLAIVLDRGLQRIVGHLTGAPLRSPTATTQARPGATGEEEGR